MSTDILGLAIRSDSHVLVLGSSGAGKTTLIRNVLSSFTSDEFSVILFDPMRLYEACCDLHAPLPVNLLEVKERLVEIIIDALMSHYRSDRYVISPMMEELLTKIVHSDVETIDEVLQYLEKIANTTTRHDVMLSALALKRRLSCLSCWIFERTHRVLRRIRDGKLRGFVIGLDISFLSDMQRVTYVLSVIEYTLSANQGLVYVLDEAHLLLRRNLSMLAEYLRVGRNLRKLFILLTHSKRDIPETLLDVVRMVVEFPTVSTTSVMPLGVARLHVLSRGEATCKFIRVKPIFRTRKGIVFRRILQKALAEHFTDYNRFPHTSELLRKSLRDRDLGKKIMKLLDKITIAD